MDQQGELRESRTVQASAPPARTPAPPAKKRKTHWRDNIEALTVAIIMAVMLKYFIVEAYKIPTGSMQPTLMGNDETGIFDRILVDKLSFHFRDPERFEVVVFKYPLDRSKNFIKRIVGMPGEQLRIWLGDLWTRESDAQPWKILRRPAAVQRETWRALDLADDNRAGWRAENASGWTVGHRSIQARGDGRARFQQRNQDSIRDHYTDGYPTGMVPHLRLPTGSGANSVGDLRATAEVRALPGLEEVAFEIVEGPRRYTLTIPGPKSPDGARPTIRAQYGSSDVESAKQMPSQALGEPYRLPAGKSVSVAAQNLDDLLSLEIDGKTVAELEVAAAADNSPSTWNSAVWIAALGEGADFEELQTFRDIFYTSESKSTQVSIPPDSYYMLGDNTQNSSDSRMWTLERMRWPGSEGRTVRGNNSHGENPVDQMSPDGEGMQTFFRDEWGELFVFPTRERERVGPEVAPFVPRNLITGRAVLVFWPIAPSMGVWRMRWVH